MKIIRCNTVYITCLYPFIPRMSIPTESCCYTTTRSPSLCQSNSGLSVDLLTVDLSNYKHRQACLPNFLSNNSSITAVNYPLKHFP